MNTSLKRRIERMERAVKSIHRGSEYGGYEDAGGIILIPELLRAGRKNQSEVPPDDSPERLEELQRRGRELRQRIAAQQRLRRILNPRRR